jgi:bacterial/archaeal transporter family protein
MNWIVLSLLSAALLGVYDLFKKASLRENAVPPVLFANVLTGALVWLPLAAPTLWGWQADWWGVRVEPISRIEHLLLALKSVLVGSSWTCAFFAIKHLPISIATPIRATSPLWTISIAVVLMHERPSLGQWLGILLILMAFLAFSRVGKAEGIRFHRNRWVALMLLATLLGSFSALYDKFLLQTVGLGAGTVQAWFSIYLIPIMLPLTIRWYLVERSRNPFQWRWSIPLIAFSLLVADYLYFSALRQPEAMISLVSPLRRTSVVVTYLAGIVWLHEKNWLAKGWCIALLLCGVYLVSLG